MPLTELDGGMLAVEGLLLDESSRLGIALGSIEWDFSGGRFRGGTYALAVTIRGVRHVERFTYEVLIDAESDNNVRSVLREQFRQLLAKAGPS